MSNVEYVAINLHEAGEYSPPFLTLHGSEYISEMGRVNAKTSRRYIYRVRNLATLWNTLHSGARFLSH